MTIQLSNHHVRAGHNQCSV